MEIEFSLPSCIATGVCSSCGACSNSQAPAKKELSEYNDQDAGEAKAIIWTDSDPLVWTGGRVHSPTVLTYSISNADHPTDFAMTAWGALYAQIYGFKNNWEDFTSYQKTAIRAAATKFSEASGIFLVEVDASENADIEWHYGDADPSLGIVGAVAPDGLSDSIGSHLFVNKFFSQYWETVDFRPGQPGFAHLMHEFGHAVNLKHPFYGKYQLPSDIENRSSTVMSHQQNPDGTFATDLRPLDKQALQYLYGTVDDRADRGVEWRQWQDDGLISIADDQGRLIKGIEGRDLAVGGQGDDVILTFGGDDWVRVSKGRDYISGGAGNDTLVIEPGSMQHLRLYLLASAPASVSRSGFLVDEAGNVTHFDGFEFLQQGEKTYSLAGSLGQPNNTAVMSNLYAMIFSQDARMQTSATYNVARLNAGELPIETMIREFIDSLSFDRPSGWASMAPGQQLAALASRLIGDVPSSSLVSSLAATDCDLVSSVKLLAQYFGPHDAHMQPSALEDLNVVEREIPEQNTIYASEVEYNLAHIYKFLFNSGVSESEIQTNMYELNWMSSSYKDIVDSLVNSARFKSELSHFDPQKLSLLSGVDITLEDLRSSNFNKGSLILQKLGLREEEHTLFNVQERDGTGGFFFFNRGTFKEVQSALRSDQVREMVTNTDGHLMIKDWRNDVIDLGAGVSKVEFKDGTLFVGQANKYAIIDFLKDNLLPSMDQATAERLASMVGTHSASARKILEAVATSDEFAAAFSANFSAMPTSQFITSQFKSLLGRDATVEERASMASSLEHGTSRLDAFRTVAFSTEFVRSLDSEPGITSWHEDHIREMNFRAWEVVQNMSGDYYESLQKQGNFTFEQVVDFMMLSPAYTQQVSSSYGNEAWLNVMYRRTFGEEPTAEKLSPWSHMLQDGLTRTEVVTRLLTSVEERVGFLKQGQAPEVDGHLSKTIADLRSTWDPVDHGNVSLQPGTRDVDVVFRKLLPDGYELSLNGVSDAHHFSVSGVLKTASGEFDVQAANRIKFLDGTLSFDPADPVVRIEALYGDLLSRTSSGAEKAAALQGWREGGIDAVLNTVFSSPEFQAKSASMGNAEFASAGYQAVLNREADAGGLAATVAALDGGLSRLSWLKGTYHSAEYDLSLKLHVPETGAWITDPGATSIARLYQTTLSRAPDEQGFVFWTQMANSGLKAEQMVHYFVTSPEAGNRFTGGNDQFVSQLYETAFHRTAELDGYNGWKEALDHGWSRESIVQVFSESPEMAIRSAAMTDHGIVFS